MNSCWEHAVTEHVEVARLGVGGDGIVETASGPIFVPYGLAGERVVIEHEGSRGHLVAIETASPARATPFCEYFGRCGGCVAQHMAPPLYGDWKRSVAVGALGHAGIAESLAPLVDAHGEGRRRITLHARIRDGRMQAGFMERRRHDLVAINHCPVAVPGLQRAPAVAAALAGLLAGMDKPIDVAVTDTETGLDVDLRGSGPPSAKRRTALIQAAAELDLARLSVHGETLVERRRPVVRMGPSRVTPAPGGFLQATAAGEAALAERVLAACRGAKRVVDLFAGCGPFTLRLAETAEIHAVETDAGALLALDRAFRETPGLRKVTTERRDLFRRPLLPLELDPFDAVVLDPPRAGAEAQVRQIAESRVSLAVMVSCDPGTYARDAAILTAAGFAVEATVPVDQFKWAPPIELVGVFRRKVAVKKRVSLRPR
jgi:23S rRNA (uracil1939-C5)-methyltransferase